MYMSYISLGYLGYMLYTRWLMLRRRTLSHSASSTSNYIARSCQYTHSFHRTALASLRFGHVTASNGLCAEKCWNFACLTGTAHIARQGSTVSTLSHCESTKQYETSETAYVYTLTANSKG